jgi:endonuclease G
MTGQTIMSGIEEVLTRLRSLNEQIRQQDPKLDSEALGTPAAALETVNFAPQSIENAVQLESIVLRRLRPVLAIKNNTVELSFTEESDCQLWKDRLTRAKDNIDRAIRSVGRIELQGGRLDWVGTGWLVAENVLVTNRHVANEFALRRGGGFAFRMGTEGPISACTDFLQEIDNPETLEFELVKPLYIEEEPGPDVSFFRIEPVTGYSRLADPIDLTDRIEETTGVAIIGYPGYDSRIAEPDLIERLYGGVYDKKRLAPGAVTKVEKDRFLHNCTTLCGNSGSLVLDLETGNALGLHFSGSFLATNYAVRADVVGNLLKRVRSDRTRRKAPAAISTSRLLAPSGSSTGMPQGWVGLTIPSTVSIGKASGRLTALRIGSTQSAGIDRKQTEIEAEEGRVEDYKGRKGYDVEFLGKRYVVELPTIIRNVNDVLKYKNGAKTDQVLRYLHYSVVMCRSRRMCFFSAVNINGNLLKKSARAAWKWDPRIPKAQQIMNECYGNPPKFSRGHMTRREDPGWGKDAKTAKRGNEDTMHVTNTTPQIQAFNAPIWLALEDYALQHARQDEMKISVFTGPYFGKCDPTMHGVRIPLAFWKVIAFVHDDTTKLCATGYEMDQQQSIQPDEEFVFGAFRSPQLGIATQVPIRSIELKSGLRFGELRRIDPLAQESEELRDGGVARVLLALEQIQFVR